MKPAKAKPAAKPGAKPGAKPAAPSHGSGRKPAKHDGALRAKNLKNIVWLASYPKSGNTWVRIFLANYIFNPAEPWPINKVHLLGMGDAITKTYAEVCKGWFDAADPDLTLGLRHRVLRRLVNNGADINFVKTHNIRARARGVTLIPDELTKCAVYIARDPRDMAVSYARHYGMTLDKTIESIARADNVTAGGGEAVTQFLGNWSDHANAWTRRKAAFPVLTLRYEDMLAAPEEAFERLLGFTGVGLGDDARRDRAIRFSAIREMQKQEKAAPFVERSARAERFFARGTSGHWREVLSAAQAAEIERAHGTVMRRFGYL